MNRNVLLGLLLAVFCIGLLLNTWIVDDAYITFRVVDNWIHGRGLTWNPGERVQVFTHPLWMLTMSAAYVVTRDFFVMSTAVSLLLCLATIAILRRSLAGGEPWRFALLLGLLTSSKAFMDYTSSGLENPLAYMLAALFWVQMSAAATQPPQPQRVAVLWFIASLAFLNRYDAVLLYLPALGWITWRTRRALGFGAIWPRSALATLPAILWLLFATFYYGFPLPNTYYAKAAAGVPLDDRLQRGVAYCINSVQWDTASHVLVLIGAALAVRRRHSAAIAAFAGIGLYMLYVLFNASATHMSGRFYAVPFCIALLFVARLWPSARTAAVLGAALLLWNAINPRAPLKMGTRFYRSDVGSQSRIDANDLVHRHGPRVLFGHRGDRRVPDVDWFQIGLAFRSHPAKLHVGGPNGSEPVGFFAFAAGHEKTILDYCGLTDPLLARLHACNVARPELWKSGHFYRLPPDGYVQTLARGENVIVDPGVRDYYARLHLVSRDPDLWRPARLAAILRLNTGRYDHLLAPYERHTRNAFGGDCWPTLQQLVGAVR